MKNLICATAAVLALTAGAALADTPAAEPAPVVLNDAQLDNATGGLLSILNNVLSSNSGLVNANVNVPVNVSNIALLSNAKQSNKTNQSAHQGISTGITGVISGKHGGR